MAEIFVTAGKSIAITLIRAASQDPTLPPAVQTEIHEGDIEFINSVMRLHTENNKRIGEIAALARILQEDRPTLTVLGNLKFEAAREALHERRLMLAAAVGGILRPEFDTQRRARLERKLRELDPSDVRLLYGISLVPKPAMEESPRQPGMLDDHHAMARLEYASSDTDQFEILISSGCIKNHALKTYTGDGCSLTSVGADILKVVEDYVVDQGPLSPLPPPRRTRGRVES